VCHMVQSQAASLLAYLAGRSRGLVQRL